VLIDSKPTTLLRATPGPQPLQAVLLVDVTTLPAIARRDLEQGIDRFVASLLPGDALASGAWAEALRSVPR